MVLNIYNNNPVFDTSVSFPIEEDGHLVISEGYKLLSGIKLIESRLFVSARTYLACIDIYTKELLWERTGKRVSHPVAGEDGRIYAYDFSPVCYDAKTGEELWMRKGRDYPLCASEKNIYCRDVLTDSSIVICRAKDTGEEQWRIKAHGSFNWAASENGITVIQGSDGFHVCKDENGDVLWDDTKQQWLQKNFSGKKYGPFASLGPLVNGVIYIGFKEGMLAAINAESGDLVWSYELDQPHCPFRILSIQDKIYFTIDQAWGDKNYLTCLDSKSGQLIYTSDENISPIGCNSLIGTDRFIIGGSGAYLSFFNIDEMKYVWRYKNATKEDCFTGNIIASNNCLITYNNSLKKIYWFKSKGNA